MQLVESTGISFGSTATSLANGGVACATDMDLLALMRQIEPGADNGALVPARNLRRAAQLDKRDFDGRVLDLARAGRLTLHRHDFATGLSTTERDELVCDGAGTFYVGMALRRGTN